MGIPFIKYTFLPFTLTTSIRGLRPNISSASIPKLLEIKRKMRFPSFFLRERRLVALGINLSIIVKHISLRVSDTKNTESYKADRKWRLRS